MSFSSSVIAFDVVNESELFPKVAQGHHGNNDDSCHGVSSEQLKINDQATIYGTGGAALNYCSSNHDNGLLITSCDDNKGGLRQCTITGKDIRGLKLFGNNDFLPSNGSGGSYSQEHCRNQQLTIGGSWKNQFQTVSIYSTCTVTLSANYNQYRFKKLELGKGATLILPQGDYWVESFILNQGAKVILQGNVRIFIEQKFELTGAKFNENNTASALIIGYSDIELHPDSVLNGLVYSDKKLTLNKNAIINGRVTSNSLEMNDISRINDKTPGLQVHHFEFDYSASPLTCKAETMAVRACANADCSQLFTAPVTAQLSMNPNKNGAWFVNGVNSNLLTFNNGIATAALRYNVVTPTVTIGVSSSNPLFGGNTLCRKGSGSLNSASCTLAFAESGFIFDVPDKLANKPTTITISAVRKSNSSLECVPAFSDATKNVGFWSSYITPSSIPADWQQAITIKGTASTSAPIFIAKNESSRTAIPLKFTKGVASVEVNYPDAGKLALNARLDGIGDNEGLVMVGSDQFVSVPAGLCVKPVETHANCSSADKTCNAYRKAGQTFGMTVQAMAWQTDNDSDFCVGNLSTPNYSDSQMTLASKVIAPTLASGADNGKLGVTSYDHSAQRNNLNTINNQSISEVGVFQIAATAKKNYLGSATHLNIPTAHSSNLGRFVPDHFRVSDTSVTPACGNFSYMDQPFPMAMKISAQNVAGEVTKNYFPPFSFATATLVAENNNNGIDLLSRLSALPVNSSSWAQGEAVVGVSHQANVSRMPPNVSANVYQDGPFEFLDIGVQVQDNDPYPNKIYSYVADADMDAASVGICTNCNAKKISNQTLRHGRVVMDNTYGPENVILAMPVRAEYWNGNDWAINTADNCTTAVYDLASQLDAPNLGYKFSPALVTGQSVRRSGVDKFQAGQLQLLWQTFAASGTPYRGQVTAPLDVPTWLEWYWNWDGTMATQLSEPRASAYFGSYRGSDKIIYWREVN
ncbi:hypothetical protein FJQ87_10400 [Shewanella sp. SNU WT4]|uniref:DUF6701 domain-containing protein n=1 Tax=Shewanella sp. SNU WT4 TaxID=2590015 RepID=UPI00112B92BD|nr:DUF6701 domain-containing protein [Shewanella sp. SNU WT4]QDF68521.1 hypothetical protein FJQ87_10400 [Shewanella sp. SNU WT4]